jgi:HEAT repeat protein
LEEGNTTQGRGRRKRIVIVLIICALVGIGVVAFWPGEREPEYNGKKLSEWCLFYWWTPDGPSKREQAHMAINHIGTNALPFLLEWLRYDHPTPKERTVDIIDWLRVRLTKNTVRISLRPLVRAQVAGLGFEALGTNASPAIPALAKLIRDRTSSATTTRAAAAALACTGPQGIQKLEELLRDPTQPNRVHILMSLISGGESEPATAQVLMQFVEDPDDEVAFHSAANLGGFRPVPAGAVAILKKGLADSRAPVRLGSADSLANIGIEASAAVPDLVQTLQDSDPMVRNLATNALLKIAPEVLTNGVKDF